MRRTLRDIGGLVPDVTGRLTDLRTLPFQRRRGPSATSVVAAISLLGVGLGAALMYLFDPRSGHRRRAIARDTVTSFVRRSSAAVDSASRDVATRARGLVIEMRSRLAGGASDPAGTEHGTARTERGADSPSERRRQP